MSNYKMNNDRKKYMKIKKNKKYNYYDTNLL